MAALGDNAALRAATATLAAVALLLVFFIWQSFEAVMRAHDETARSEAARADALALARVLDRAGGDPSAELGAAVAAFDSSVAAAVYEGDGRRVAVASRAEGSQLVDMLPAAASADREPPTTLAQRGDARVLALRLAGGRTLVVARAGGPAESWRTTIVAYEALSLLVLLAAIAFALRRLSRATHGRYDAKPGPAGALADGPRREADFVVETFQSVIGELQDKGRKLELQSLRERERAERSERFSERVIAQMPTGLVVVDRAGRVMGANASARDIFAELPRTRTEAVSYERAFGDAPGLVRMVGECLESGAAFQRSEIEMRVAAGEARARCLGVSVTPIAPAGSPESALCLMTDLTEVIELRDRVRLQETMATLGEMAAGLTHELKNSLATIQGFAQLIAEVAPESAAESADALVEEVGQLSRMVTDFLNFARPQELAAAAIPVVDLVESAAARLEGRFEAAGVEFSLEAAPDAAGARVLGDETLLGRALLNVLQNAAEALEAAPRPRRVTVTVLAPGDEVVLEIRDTGPGIPAADLPKIFIPFFTTRSRGYGIGLALTQKIVLAHGGRITAENAEPGALIRCALPAAAPPEIKLPGA